MRHRKHTFKINRTGSHRRAMMANMACSLIMEGQIKTTLVRAKELRKIVEKMITLGKRGSLHTRRQAIAYLRQPATVRFLFDEIAPRFADRTGGYTRIMKLGPRKGDAAEMCIIEILNEQVATKTAAPVAEEAVAEEEVKAEAPAEVEEAPVAEEATEEAAEEAVEAPAEEEKTEE